MSPASVRCVQRARPDTKNSRNIPTAAQRPWELPKRPEFDVDFLVKQHQEQANNYYKRHLETLSKVDRYAAQEIDTGIPVSAEERAARATHDADKKRVDSLRYDINHHTEQMRPLWDGHEIQPGDLRKWISIVKDYQKRYAETKLFDPQALARLRAECREMDEVVKRLRVSCERFNEKIPYGIPEPATYDAEALIAAHAKRFSDYVLENLDEGLAYASPRTARLIKEGKTVDEIVAVVEQDRQEQLDKLLAERKEILETLQKTQQKFEAATTLEEMKTMHKEANRIYNDVFSPNKYAIGTWHARTQRLAWRNWPSRACCRTSCPRWEACGTASAPSSKRNST